MSYWRSFPKTTPKPVKDGIKAKSRRGDFGESWVGKEWIEVLKSFGRSNRLTRGKRYARKGQVRDFQVEKGEVTAQVQGSRSSPYSVSIELPPYPESAWEEIVEEISSVPLYYSAFSSGQVPEDFKGVLSELDLSLPPENSKELSTRCSCPDSANPCKHIAAVYYLLGEAFDEDPFQLIKIRGRTREELLNAISASGGGPEEETAPSPEPDRPLDTTPERFWRPGPELPPAEGGEGESKVDPTVLKLLGPPQFLPDSKKYRRSLRKAYEIVSS